MRKRRSFKDGQSQVKEAPKNKAGKYMAIFIASVMVLSIGGVFLSNPDSESDYSFNGHNFKNSNGVWITKISGKEIIFYALPQEVEYLNVSKQAINIIKNSQMLIVTSSPVQDPPSRLQYLDQFKFDFRNAYVESYPGKKAGSAVTQKINDSKIPVFTCDNSSYLFPVISLEFSNETSIRVDKDCVVVSATDERSLLALLDNLRYNVLGVFK